MTKMACTYIQVVDRVFLVKYRDVLSYEKDLAFEHLCSFDDLAPPLATEDSFSPPDLGRVFEFCQRLHHRLHSTDRFVAVIASAESKHFMSAVFLVGAYIIMKLEKDLNAAMQYLDPILVDPYHHRDSSGTDGAARLQLQDCLAALERAKLIGWTDFDPDRFDVEEYRQLDNPLNADLHEVVPSKIIMMRSPHDLVGGLLWRDVPNEDGRFGQREFSPAHYAEILEQLGVCAVVRCSAPTYCSDGFESAGIAVVDLCCEDDAVPPIDVVSKFLAVAEQLPGALAVHCRTGRTRSGTLVALYLMKHHGFSAREAIGWLRIVRPGW